MIEHDGFYDIFGDEISMVRIDCFFGLAWRMVLARYGLFFFDKLKVIL